MAIIHAICLTAKVQPMKWVAFIIDIQSFSQMIRIIWDASQGLLIRDTTW